MFLFALKFLVTLQAKKNKNDKCINWRGKGERERESNIKKKTEFFPFKVTVSQITNNSPRVTPTSVSLSSSQQLCKFGCPGRYTLRTQEQSYLFKQNVTLNIQPQQISSKLLLLCKFV